MNQAAVRERTRAALEALFQNDAYLLEVDAGERAVAAVLARYLAGVFPSHHVDVEYNRHGIEPKTLNLPNGCPDAGERYIFPDVIVHRRGKDESNLLAIEIKKVTNRTSRDCDRAKVIGLMEQLDYTFGLLLEFPVSPQPRIEQVREEWLYRTLAGEITSA